MAGAQVKKGFGGFISCPECVTASVRVQDGRIIRHERGLGYVPYRLYHKFHRRHPRNSRLTVKAQAKRNLCTASGKLNKGSWP